MFSLPTIASTTQPRPQHNGWSVPLGVHKVICVSPGLRVSTQIHRRSIPIRVNRVMGQVDDTMQDGMLKKVARKDSHGGGQQHRVEQELIIPPGSYVEILETQVHGERVRGRICWEEEEECFNANAKKNKKKSIKKRTSRLLQRTSRKKRDKSTEISLQIVRYEGWISLQWARSEEEKDENEDEDGESGSGVGGSERGIGKGRNGSGRTSMEGRVTDDDSGPWTEPVPLGVYRINFGGGLPLRKTPERDSTVIGKLDRGRCVEVVQTQVKGDRVRARVIVPNLPQKEEDGESNINSGGGNKKASRVMKFTSGWISLLNALTGSSGASPVPLGAYVVVAEPGCVITEGGRLDSKVKSTLVPGSCMEVVATRMEEGVVRGLIASGGHVTLFVPPDSSRKNTAATTSDNNSRKNADGGRMFAMPVPLGTYQIIHSGLTVTTGIESTSSIVMKLQLNATAEVTETRVENGRVRGRICAVVNEDGSRVVGYEKASGSDNASGWINLFEPNQRWAKIVCFKGGRPVGGGAQSSSRRRSSQNNRAAVC